MRRIDAARGRRPLGGRVPRRRPGPLDVRRSRRGPTRFASWRDELEPQGRRRAGTTSRGELSEGALLLERGCAAGQGRATARRSSARRVVRDTTAPSAPAPRSALALDLLDAAASATPTAGLDDPDQPVELDVDRERARFGAWYELFPRSWGGFDGVAQQLPAARRARLRRPLPPADPPDRPHEPQGRATTRSSPAPDDPGQPVGDRRRDRRPRRDPPRPRHARRTSTRSSPTAREHGIEIALDFAIQCSADHPWLTEHPEWFNRRPDGTLKYAENPPKKYQDIYNVNWDSPRTGAASGRRCSTSSCTGSTHGVRVFRVDNPHTKPLPFWEWLIARGPRRSTPT